MIYQIIFSLILALSAFADPAPVSHDSPENAKYVAHFSKGDIQGFVAFFSFGGYVFSFSHLQYFPEEGLPYDYRIHQRPVPLTGDCYPTLGILDPYDGVFDAASQSEFKVGDLSGKHGDIEHTEFLDTYLDPYLSLNPSNPAFLGDKGMVITSLDGDRIDCVTIDRSSEAVPPNILAKAKQLVKDFEQSQEKKKKGSKKAA